MQIRDEVTLLRITTVSVVLALFGIQAFATAAAQANPAPPSASSPIQLQPYAAPDNSASAGVPAGWQVIEGTGTVISMKGPQGEYIALGDGAVAHDGPFQPGQKGPAGSQISMPSTAKLTDKLVMLLQQRAAINGNPVPQIKFLYAAPLQAPPALGQCGRFVIDVTGVATPGKGMGIFCSLPIDSGQLFKNFYLMGSAPSAIAAQDLPIVQAVFASYKISPDWIQRKFAPATAPSTAALAGAAQQNAAIVNSFLRASSGLQNAVDLGATCEQYSILSASNRQTPRECGGLAPNP